MYNPMLMGNNRFHVEFSQGKFIVDYTAAHTVYVGKEKSREYAMSTANHLKDAYAELARYHKAVAEFLERYDEVDIAEMLDTVEEFLDAKSTVEAVLRGIATGGYITTGDDDKSRKDFFNRIWHEYVRAMNGVSEVAEKAYRLFVGDFAELQVPKIPIHRWSSDFRTSRLYYDLETKLKKAAYEIVGGMTVNSKDMYFTFKTHADAERFLTDCGYTVAYEEGGIDHCPVRYKGDEIGVLDRRETSLANANKWMVTFCPKEVQWISARS